ncbi:hypothetical protein DC083_06050 [Ignatzschineria ureiclastica]|uniref:HTH merR-type domain-containing protein n=1 Tax=Ignatzschineria ureiclastica TaxID=472582 RepID=A0A2U2ADF4_9GAMM|nr:MerR family transcriptional regulator [Ignatzschineria ureiclastica]PWD80681.1 hypothetical protein DC083_06050 [Ignatzschineria ureiclastica]GGZ95364.1 hypothetical protein GCM10007162_09430 [Ignatzschineria ureiclastica]
MRSKQTQYYTIGELAKIKDISIKNLRYYDEIGVLTPAYTNPDNHYRYYTYEQFYAVDLIKFCLSLNVPLKTYKKYIEGDQIDLENFLTYCQERALEQRYKAERNCHYVEKAFNDLDTLKHYPLHKPFQRELPERQLYLMPYFGEYGTRSFSEAMTELKHQLAPYIQGEIFDYGIITHYQAQQQMRAVYCIPHQSIEIDLPTLLLPSLQVNCVTYTLEQDSKNSAMQQLFLNAPPQYYLLEKELCSSFITTSKTLLEMQCYPL